jgi:hypothetical protein
MMSENHVFLTLPLEAPNFLEHPDKDWFYL